MASSLTAHELTMFQGPFKNSGGQVSGRGQDWEEEKEYFR